MKKCRNLIAGLLVFCLVLTGAAGILAADMASAKEITTLRQAKKLAKKAVKGAVIVEAEQDYDDGIHVYEIELVKGKKEYNLMYRASDSKLISYSWEIASGYVKKGKGRIISRKKCKKLAKKKVSKGKILSVMRKRDDGIDYYKVKMRKGGKKYELHIHAHTGKLLEYEWELTASHHSANTKEQGSANQAKTEKNTQTTDKPQTTSRPRVTEKPQTANSISLAEAKEIALSDAGLTADEVVFTKAEYDFGNCLTKCEIEFYTTTHEYEYEINASGGSIMTKEIEVRDTGWKEPSGNTETYIGVEKAKQIALDEMEKIVPANVNDVTVIKTEFDMDDGIPVYEVEVLLDKMEYDIEIHAVTGVVLKTDRESIYD